MSFLSEISTFVSFRLDNIDDFYEIIVFLKISCCDKADNFFLAKNSARKRVWLRHELI